MSKEHVEEKRETPTQTLIRTLEYFSEDEPTDVIVCWMTENELLYYSGNDINTLKAIGILELTKARISKEKFDEKIEYDLDT